MTIKNWRKIVSDNYKKADIKDWNELDEQGNTALIGALLEDEKSAFKWLLDDKKVNPDLPDSNGSTPLGLAVFFGEKGYCKKLLKYGANINLKGSSELTPLQIAAHKGFESITELLIEKGADVNEIGFDGNTALLIATNGGFGEIVKALLKAGAKMDAVTSHGDTAFLWAVKHDKYDVVKNILKHAPKDYNFNETNAQNGFGALHYCAHYGFEDMAEKLLREDLNINLTSDKKASPLYQASVSEQKDLVKLFLNKDADTEIVDLNGNTALSAACVKGNMEIAKMLIGKGADIHHVNTNGEGVLHMAAASGNAELVKYLLEQGVEDSASKDGITAENIAQDSAVQQVFEEWKATHEAKVPEIVITPAPEDGIHGITSELVESLGTEEAA